MVYLQNDYYTASGSVKLYHSWTDKVTKFDTSSFYNWEQDNLPLYDLDERTYYLWEQLGHPTSSIPGVALVVSAGGDSSEYEYNRNNFETVSAAIAALPQVLNYPVIIEICNKGELGSLELKNIKCGPNGSLEIVNKVFAKAEPDFGNVNLNRGFSLTSNDYGLLSSISGTLAGLSFGLSFSPRKHFYDTKSEFLNLKVFDTTSLNGIDNYLNGFISVNQEALNTRSTYFIKSTSPNGATSSVLNVVPYETTSDAINNQLVASYDISAYDTETDDKFTDLAPENTTLTRLVGLFYGNTLTKVIVANCDGPIYLRNLFIDGSGYTTSNKNGLEVTNSRNIIIENCVSVRNTNAGFYFNNSKIILTRGIGAYRNYGFVSNTRLTEPNNEVSIDRDERDSAAGLYAINSEIQFSSTSAFERSVFNSDPIFSAVSSQGSLSYGSNYVLNFSRNANGIVLDNSKFFGGITGSSSITLTCELNNLCGLKITNSNVDWEGRLKLRQNLAGLVAKNSNLVLDKYTIRENTRVGLKLINSNLLYNKKLNGSVAFAEEQFKFDYNGKHIHLNNSNYKYNSTTDAHTVLGIHRILNSNKRSILIENSSDLQLAHGFIRSRADLTTTEVKYGDPIAVENSSKATFKGSGFVATTIVGSENVNYRLNSCGVYAGRNSNVSFQGPTAIARYEINCLAEDNSIINFEPHKNEYTGDLEITEFNLNDPSNHTMVELHSTKACLVINKNSVLNIKDLGSFLYFWDRSTAGSLRITSGLDYDENLNEYEPYVSAGYFQFYPNPMGVAGGNPTSVTALSFSIGNVDGLDAPYYLFNRDADFNNFSSITRGGVCLRAVNNSVVDVKNVNFPTGFWNPSGVFFNAAAAADVGDLCCKLMIWNIADNSQLHASYLSVSSHFPTEAGYHGPFGTWLSYLKENGGLSGGLVSGAFPNDKDPYASSYALLDFAGSGPATIPIYSSSFINQGPFRLFFSTDPAVSLLGLASTEVTNSLGGYYFSAGWIPQIFAQGYCPPGYLSATSSVSALHKTVVRYKAYTNPFSNEWSTSGIFRPSPYNEVLYNTNNASNYLATIGAGMTHDPYSTRVFLDESASNTFANAKHCAVGKSGAPKIVSIYYPYITAFGDSNVINKVVATGLSNLNSFDLTRDN